MACYAQIRNTNSHILAKGKGLSSEHPRFYSIMRGRSISKTKEGSYVFSGENISKCKNAHQSKGLIKRIHQVVFHDQSIPSPKRIETVILTSSIEIPNTPAFRPN